MSSPSIARKPMERVYNGLAVYAQNSEVSSRFEADLSKYFPACDTLSRPLVCARPAVWVVPAHREIENGLNDGKASVLNRNEYRLLVQLWDRQRGRFYWADNETDVRDAQERLESLRQEGWETVSTFPCGAGISQNNYLLRVLAAFPGRKVGRGMS